MPGFGCTSTVRTIFAPAAPLISAGIAAMSACLEVGAPRNCRLGVACAKTTDESRTMKAVLFTHRSYTTIDAEHAEPAEAVFRRLLRILRLTCYLCSASNSELAPPPIAAPT